MQNELRFNPRAPRVEVEGKLRGETGKTSGYAIGGWKKSLPPDHVAASSRASSRQSAEMRVPQSWEDISRNNSVLLLRKEEERRKQDQAMRKVRQLQEKVRPMMSSRENDRDDIMLAWQTRIQQKLVRLQTQVDCIKKEASIELEKRILFLQAKWDQRLCDLENKFQTAM